MVGQDIDHEGEASGPWRGLASVGAIVATILLVLLVVMVTFSNRAREQALGWERRTYDVMLLSRTVDATIARAEAALGRYVLDELPATGTLYYNEWRLAGRQIGQLQRLVTDDEQDRRLDELKRLYRVRGEELAGVARSAAAKQGSGGLNFFYEAGKSETGPALRKQLEAIAAAERDNLRARMEDTSSFGQQADKLIVWLSWLGVLIGLGSIFLGLLAWRALSDRFVARRLAESETHRAMALEQAVQERTRELSEANEMLRAEAAERAAAEEQLRQVQKMEAIGQLTGGIAHDFNNMLAVIVGGLDLARRKLHGPIREVEFHLENAMEGANRAAALTSRLLAFARSEPMMPKAIAPAELVENMLDLIDRAIGERISVRTEFAADPWYVWADTNQLENAILNLCVNARDAMNGQGQVTIATANETLAAARGGLEPGEYVRISVTDTGVGILPEHVERVFEPFFTTKSVGKGTGLGLSQIFGFARQSGGDVVIDSTVGEGTTVALYLPRSLRVPEAPSEPSYSLSHGLIKAASPASILVVEDDPRVSRATVGALEELGYVAVACASGREALEILEQDPSVELVITDVMMPEMTGPELVSVVSERFPDVGILFVTGFVGEASEAEQFAGHEILRKPFTVAGLSVSVAGALGRRVSELPPASAAGGAR